MAKSAGTAPHPLTPAFSYGLPIGEEIEAMKMLTTVCAPTDGTIEDILVKKGVQVDSDDLWVILE